MLLLRTCVLIILITYRWDKLIETFRHENYRLFQLASQSVFTVTLQAGLSALKTPRCYSASIEGRNPNCPVCNEALNKLAAPLPFAHCSQSRLFCSISGKPLNEHNQPMMMPNGYVYGEEVSKSINYTKYSSLHTTSIKVIYFQLFLYVCSIVTGVRKNGSRKQRNSDLSKDQRSISV